MKRLALTVLVLLVPLAAFVGSAAGDHRHKQRFFKADLNGYNEVNGGQGGAVIGSVSTAGEGSLELEIVDDDNLTGLMRFRLRYTLENAVTVAHVHFAQRHVGGPVVFFFCGGGSKPAACPDGTIPTEAVLEGTITPADITSTPGATSQGIGAGDFAETVRAIRAGAAYANVHSARWPAGEIRGQIEPDEDDDRDKDRDHDRRHERH